MYLITKYISTQNVLKYILNYFFKYIATTVRLKGALYLTTFPNLIQSICLETCIPCCKDRLFEGRSLPYHLS